MTQEGRFALLGLWSVVKIAVFSAGVAYIIEARVTDVMAMVAVWYIWADRVMNEEHKAERKAKEGK